MPENYQVTATIADVVQSDAVNIGIAMLHYYPLSGHMMKETITNLAATIIAIR